MNVFGYARLSSLSEESTSIARQREVIEKEAQQRGWTLVDIIEDDGVSASIRRLDRPGMTQLRARIADGEAAAVVVWRLDRIARSVVDFGTLLDEGIQIASATEPLDTTTIIGRAMAEILQVFAAMESKTIAERVKSSFSYLRRQGRFPGGRVPFGYWPAPNPSGPGRILKVHPPEAALLHELSRRIVEGESLTKIVADLNGRELATGGSPFRRAEMAGLPTEGLSKGTWRLSALKVVMTADSLLGRVTEHGKLVIDDDGSPFEAFEPILDLATLARIRARLGDPRNKDMPKSEPKVRASRLLSGVAFCAYCDKRLYVGSANGKATYRCPDTHPDGSPTVRVNALTLEEYITNQFLAIVGEFEEVEVVDRVVDDGVAAELAEVRAALRETAAEFADPDANRPALLARLDQLQIREASLASMPSTIESFARPTGRLYREAWAAEDDLDRRRAVLRLAIDHVTVSSAVRRGNSFDNDRVHIYWNS
jgi:site-specific DNA recombinase